jgi:hypothetical protein
MTMQMRRLDPLANAGPFQKLMASPIKSVSLSEPQFARVNDETPQLILTDGTSFVLGRLYRDRLEIHYGFSELETFRTRFTEMFERVVSETNKAAAPRGLVLAFRDRPNRMDAETVFWALAVDQGEQWVEWNYFSAPEQPEPEADIGDGASVREATEADHDTIAKIDGEATGQPPLTPIGVATLFADSKTVRLVSDASGPVGYVALRGESGGWGVIDTIALKPGAEGLRAAVIRWSVAWLRNNGGRRIRHRIPIDDSATNTIVRDIGFTPGETGIDFTRTVDRAETTQKIEDRKSKGSMIKFGDWR